MNLDFLKNVEVKEVVTKAKVSKATLDKFPVEGADFRVFSNGRIFTSPATADKYLLHFGAKETIIIPGKDSSEDKSKDVPVGNGLDIFSSEDWQQLAPEETILFIGIVPRDGNGKIDVYGSTSYDDDGEPKRHIDANSVTTFVKEWLVPQLETVYGIDFEENAFVDLVIAEDYKIETKSHVYSIPKTQSRGDDKGKLVFNTRKDIDVFPLVVFQPATEPEGETVDPDQTDLEDAIVEAEAENNAGMTEGVTAEGPGNVDPDPSTPSIHNDFVAKQD